MATATIRSATVFEGRKCYACDERAVGLTVTFAESAQPACKRHAIHARVQSVCMYCEGTVKTGSLIIDGEYAHAKCHKDACRE